VHAAHRGLRRRLLLRGLPPLPLAPRAPAARRQVRLRLFPDAAKVAAATAAAAAAGTRLAPVVRPSEGEWPREARAIEERRGAQPTRVGRERGELRVRLGERTHFVVEALAPRGRAVRQACGSCAAPKVVGHTEQRARRGAAERLVHGEQPCEQLVHGVVRHPRAAAARWRRVAQLLDLFKLARREGREVTGGGGAARGVRPLARLEQHERVVDTTSQRRVVGRRGRRRAERAEIVADKVAADPRARRLPPAVRPRAGRLRQPGCGAERPEEPCGLKRLEEGDVGRGSAREARAGQQPQLARGEGAQRRRARPQRRRVRQR
jgi:hypothetical protein